MIILGIDPGTNHTGWAIVKCSDVIDLLDCGYIQNLKQKLLIEKIQSLITGLELINWNIINEVAIEDTILNINPRTSLKLASAKGAIMAFALMKNKNVSEYSPSHIKLSVTGIGNADKSLIALYISNIVKNIPLNTHIHDAVAIALCHWNQKRKY